MSDSWMRQHGYHDFGPSVGIISEALLSVGILKLGIVLFHQQRRSGHPHDHIIGYLRVVTAIWCFEQPCFRKCWRTGETRVTCHWFLMKKCLLKREVAASEKAGRLQFDSFNGEHYRFGHFCLRVILKDHELKLGDFLKHATVGEWVACFYFESR